MKNYLLFFFILFFNNSVLADKLSEKINDKLNITGSDNIEINSTDLSKDEEIQKLKKEISELVAVSNTQNSRIKKNNRNRKKRSKFKGTPEEIYQEFSNNVVYVTDKKEGYGSGFVINHNGFKIITNWHVVSNNKDVLICLKPKVISDYCSNQRFTGKVIKINKKKDLAMIEVKGLPNNFKDISFASFKDIKVGESVFALGHPDGKVWTFSSGMVSQIRPAYSWRYESSKHFANVIQTDASINPGNSGGPLFNKKKKLVGINSFASEGENLNFAISSDDLIDFINQVKQTDVESPYIKKKKKKGNTWIKKKANKEKNINTEKYNNSKKLDLNKNGTTDGWLIDENNDGKFEKAIFDLNEDGVIEAVAYDENLNENFEIIIYDKDLNGYADKAEFDENDDGIYDVIAFDYNEDGEWDKFEKI